MALPDNVATGWGVDIDKPSSAGGDGSVTIVSWLEVPCPGAHPNAPTTTGKIMPQKVTFKFTHDNSSYTELDAKGPKPLRKRGKRQSLKYCGCTYFLGETTIEPADDSGDGICFNVCFRWVVNCSGFNVQGSGQAGGQVQVLGGQALGAQGGLSGQAGANQLEFKNCVRVCLGYADDPASITEEIEGEANSREEIPSDWASTDKLEDVLQ